MPTNDTLAAHHVFVRSDNSFQRVARLRQALWRERMGYPIGLHRGQPLGSRLAMPFARDTLSNYLTDTVRDVVRAEVIDRPSGTNQVYQEPRIFNDLLSSQPLCFNIFGELQRDLGLASRVIGDLVDQPVKVTAVRFEYSPGRGDSRFTDDHSAFDVFVEYEQDGATGFFGIEVKYVENMAQAPARFRPRYAEVARDMGVFKDERLASLREAPLEQLWRDHLLAGSLLLQPATRYRRGAFVVLYPSENDAVASAIDHYRGCLREEATFRVWTLERFVETVTRHEAAWASAVRERYLGHAVM